jgi:hypothetical protein
MNPWGRSNTVFTIIPKEAVSDRVFFTHNIVDTHITYVPKVGSFADNDVYRRLIYATDSNQILNLPNESKSKSNLQKIFA